MHTQYKPEKMFTRKMLRVEDVACVSMNAHELAVQHTHVSRGNLYSFREELVPGNGRDWLNNHIYAIALSSFGLVHVHDIAVAL